MTIFRDKTPGRTRGRKLQRMRAEAFQRNPLCHGADSECEKVGRIRQWAVRDHVDPLFKGGADSESNVQYLCDECNHKKTCRDMGTRAEFFDAAFPHDLSPVLGHLTIVCGPPGSGKSTYVKQKAVSGDVVLDLDDIIVEMTGSPIFTASKDQAVAGLRVRNERLTALSRSSHKAWLIISGAGQWNRDRWAKMLGASEVIVMPTSKRECLNRIRMDTRRRARYDDRIDKWFATENYVAPTTIGIDGWPAGD